MIRLIRFLYRKLWRETFDELTTPRCQTQTAQAIADWNKQDLPAFLKVQAK